MMGNSAACVSCPNHVRDQIASIIMSSTGLDVSSLPTWITAPCSSPLSLSVDTEVWKNIVISYHTVSYHKDTNMGGRIKLFDSIDTSHIFQKAVKAVLFKFLLIKESVKKLVSFHK